jgi:hypothetical protein
MTENEVPRTKAFPKILPIQATKLNAAKNRKCWSLKAIKERGTFSAKSSLNLSGKRSKITKFVRQTLKITQFIRQTLKNYEICQANAQKLRNLSDKRSKISKFVRQMLKIAKFVRQTLKNF